MHSSAVWFTEFTLLDNCYPTLLPRYICCLVGSVLLCNVIKSLKEAVADPTWGVSTIATICDMFSDCEQLCVHGVQRHVLICVMYSNNKQV